MSQTFLIVGGTGTVGRTLTELLSAAGATVRVASRTPDTVTPAAGRVGVRLDLQDPSTFAAAVAGTDGVFVLAPPGHADQHALLAPFLAVAAKHTRKIVTMTANGVQFDETNPLRRVELTAAATGLPVVHLRPGWFMQNFNTFWLPTILGDGVIALPAGEALTAFVDARDIAGVAAVALQTSRLDGQALALTGPAALTYAAAAEVLSAASDRPIRYVAIDDARFTAGLVGAGLPADYAAVMVHLFETVRQGFAATVDPAVADILGKARSLTDYAADNAATWRR